jgi:hypothetical protein
MAAAVGAAVTVVVVAVDKAAAVGAAVTVVAVVVAVDKAGMAVTTERQSCTLTHSV